MVSLDQLAALDALLWLTSSQRAAGLERTNQSTILRRSRAVEECFGVRIERGLGGWDLRGDTGLLALERRIHQRARLRGHRPLRLHAPFWTLQGRLGQLPPGWCSNPPTASPVCENPLALLRSRVIDAALLTPTQLPERDEALLSVELYASPIELTLFPDAGLSDPRGTFERLRAQGQLRLRLPPFLPHSCLLRCREWFGQLNPAARVSRGPFREAAPLSVAFLTPEMREVQERPWLVDDSQAPQPYVERLVILAELAEEAAFQRLGDHLTALFGPRQGAGATLLRLA